MKVICKRCTNDIWYNPYGTKVARCENCNFERPFYKRTAKVERVTKSQLEAVERIKEYCQQRANGEELEVTTELTSYGSLIIDLESKEGNVFTKLSVFCFIGRRGGIKVSRASSGLTNRTKHFQTMLKK